MRTYAVNGSMHRLESRAKGADCGLKLLHIPRVGKEVETELDDKRNCR